MERINYLVNFNLFLDDLFPDFSSLTDLDINSSFSSFSSFSSSSASQHSCESTVAPLVSSELHSSVDPSTTVNRLYNKLINLFQIPVNLMNYFVTLKLNLRGENILSSCMEPSHPLFEKIQSDLNTSGKSYVLEKISLVADNQYILKIYIFYEKIFLPISLLYPRKTAFLPSHPVFLFLQEMGFHSLPKIADTSTFELDRIKFENLSQSFQDLRLNSESIPSDSPLNLNSDSIFNSSCDSGSLLNSDSNLDSNSDSDSDSDSSCDLKLNHSKSKLNLNLRS